MNDPMPHPDPRQRLHPRARAYWYVTEAITSVVLLLVIAGVAFVLRWAFEIGWAWIIVPALILLVPQLTWNVLRPAVEFRQWRYDIRDDEVDLLHGILVRTRQIIPMSRIQHVDTERGPIQRRYGLATVRFYTAAGSMDIPQLSVDQAANVRDQIAALTKVHDDL